MVLDLGRGFGSLGCGFGSRLWFWISAVVLDLMRPSFGSWLSFGSWARVLDLGSFLDLGLSFGSRVLDLGLSFGSQVLDLSVTSLGPPLPSRPAAGRPVR